MKISGIGNFIPKLPTQNEKPKQIKNSEFNDMLGGFQKSDLVIIAARPSMGSHSPAKARF